MNKQNKYGALVTLYPFPSSEEEEDLKNIGDYVQTIAGMQYFPHIDEYVERDAISDFVPTADSQKVKVIMNAWWMWRPENWPPSNVIEPLPISMHISQIHADQMLAGKGLQWFKNHEPIGCRDNGTVELLQKSGIDAYYSGCLTLTLGRTFKPLSQDKRSGICFTDPFIYIPSDKIGKLLSLLRIFVAPRTIFTLSKKSFFSKSDYNNSIPFNKHRNLKTLMMACLFHKQYSRYFSNKVLRSSDYVTHVKVIRAGVDNNESLLKETYNLLQYYQTRKLVVTSRIHAALPCIGMETPVIYIINDYVEKEKWNANRLDGLVNLFRTMRLSHYGLKTTDDVLLKMKKIGEKTPLFKNKEDWKPIAAEMEKLCDNFVKESEDIDRGGVNNHSLCSSHNYRRAA